MTLGGVHVLERGYQPLRGAGRVAAHLRAEMDEQGLSAKQLARALEAWAAADRANRWPVDFRTIQNAAAGITCALDTYLALSGYFGWDFTENVQTPIHGADPLTAREAEVVRQQHQVAALQARVERDRTLRSAPPFGLGWLAYRPTEGGARAAVEDRAFDQQEAAEELGPPNLDLFGGIDL